jgi:hypothetical protein
MQEKWKDIIGYENKYQISNLGRIKSLKDRFGNYKEVIKISHANKHGYLITTLWKNSIGKTFYVHILVAKAFILNHENKPQVNHKDGIKAHCYESNLEWNTRSENEKHAREMKLKVGFPGELNPSSKLQQKDIILIRKLRNEYKIKLKVLADLFNISIPSISLIANKKNWSSI